MRKIIILLAAIAIYTTSFITNKCDHVYVYTEKPEINMGKPIKIALSVYCPQTGKHEGRELICVKCFNKIRQIEDYGSLSMEHFNIDYDYNGAEYNAVFILRVDSIGNIIFPDSVGKKKPGCDSGLHKIHW